jgi:hypothetical protein
MADLITNAEIQAAIVTWMKSRTTITNEIYDSDEIKEDQWGGTAFVYPAIRVRLISNKPENRQGCIQPFTFGIQVFTEDASSKNCDRIAGIIGKEIHSKQFSASGFLFGVFITDLVPAYHRDAQHWMAEVLCKGDVLG